jgi:uncharacterized membrane protein YkvA (DUF1232 family)
MSRKPEPPRKLKKREKSELKGRMSNFMMFLPNMIRLLGRLLKDTRVPTAEKALFLGAIIYFISPIDLIPDVFPFIGQVDDVYLIALTLLRLINRTNENVVRENWSGGGDIVGLANSIAGLAPMLLPKRVTRVLSAKVEMAPAGKIIQSITDRNTPIVREIS